MTPKHEATDAMGMESQPVDHETEAFKVLQVIEQRAWALGDEQYARLAKEAKYHLSRATTQPAEQSASSHVEGEGFAALNTGFATTVSEGNPDPARRKACIKIAFDGEGCAERAQTAFDYLDRLVKADTTRSVAVSSEAVAAKIGETFTGTCGLYCSAEITEADHQSNLLYAANEVLDLLNQARKPEGAQPSRSDILERIRAFDLRAHYGEPEYERLADDLEALAQPNQPRDRE